MPKSPRHKKPSLIPTTKETKVVPADLEQKVNALKALVTVSKLLNEVGHFPNTYRIQIEQSIAFIGGLHTQMFEETIKHPQAFMIEGLLPKTNNQDEAKNGKTETTSATV